MIYRCSESRSEDKKCEGPIKPNITFFGEILADSFQEAKEDIKLNEPDLLIVIGTSLAVKPFNRIVNTVSDSVPKVLINMKNTKHNYFDFDNKEDYPNRILLQGSCDESVRDICA